MIGLLSRSHFSREQIRMLDEKSCAFRLVSRGIYAILKTNITLR